MLNKAMSAVAVSALLMAASAVAQEDNSGTFLGGKFSANVAIATDYTFRGISQNSGDPAVSGGIDWASDLFYAGTWASTVDFNDDFGTLAAGVAGALAIFTPVPHKGVMMSLSLRI